MTAPATRPPTAGPPPAAAPPIGRPPGASDVLLSAFLVLLLVTTVLAWPLHQAGADRLVEILRLLALAVGVAAIARTRALAAAAATAGLVVGWAQVAGDERSPLLLGGRVAFSCLVAAALLVRTFRPGRVTVHRLLGGVAVYVLLAVVWGTAYQLVLVVSPGAIRGAAGPATLDEGMWLSFITLTTTGYGDVLPTSALARSLAVLEAMTGVLYPAILIARLVSLVQGPAPAAPGDGPDAPVR